jgi:anti-sigma factor RsiW
MSDETGREPAMETSDEMLMAYVDGELAAEDAAAVARAIAADPVLKRRAADFRDTRLLARGAFAEERAEPVPAALAAAVRAAAERSRQASAAPIAATPNPATPNPAKPNPAPPNPAPEAAPEIGAQIIAFPQRRRAALFALPIAASLMIAAGLAGFLIGDARAPVSDVAAVAPLGGEAAVTAVLAGLVSGEERTLADGRRLAAVASFPVDGGVCRVFTVRGAAAGAVEAVACDRGGGLSVEVAVTATDDAGAYTPASDVATGVVDAFLDAAGAGASLTVDEERTLPRR